MSNVADATPPPSAPPTPPTPPSPPKKVDINAVLKKASARAFQGGIAGAAAMGINVATLMWLRTTVNYQYRYGTTTSEALKALYKDGGIPRFYRGVVPALLQGPLSRFGDTAANTGTIELLNNLDVTKDLPTGVKTIAASVAAGLFRIGLMPIDTLKTTMQVEGKNGLPNLWKKFKVMGPSAFFQGALASAGATFVGHYPWFFVYNTLNASLPTYDDTLKKLSRAAFIGFCSSFCSDCCSNSIRVIKVYKQSNAEGISYPEAFKRVIAEDGIAGLFGRGLKTKLLSNGLQGLMFSVLWKLIDEKLFPKEKKKQ